MSGFILINSCERDRNNGTVAACRNTWLARWKDILPYYFILGRTCKNPDWDEIIVDAGDDYRSTAAKQQAAYRWALTHGIEWVYQCDTDTFCHVPRLLKCEREMGNDYRGWRSYYNLSTGSSTTSHSIAVQRGAYNMFASGGCGYILSRRALGILASRAVDKFLPELGDYWAGLKLAESGIVTVHDNRFDPRRTPQEGAIDYWDTGLQDKIGIHLGQGTPGFSPSLMQKCLDRAED